MTHQNQAQTPSRRRLNQLSQTYGPRRFRHLTQMAEREGITLAEADRLHPARGPRDRRKEARTNAINTVYPIITADDGVLDIPVIATRGRSVWLLTFAIDCPFCGRRHQHGGGNDPEPYRTGHRVAHCASWHRLFRPDCRPERTPGGRKECREEHGKGAGYYLHVVEVVYPSNWSSSKAARS